MIFNSASGNYSVKKNKRKVHKVMRNARKFADYSGMTYQQIGENMGCHVQSARKSVFQFLNGKNPTVEMLLRFADAIDVDVREFF